MFKGELRGFQKEAVERMLQPGGTLVAYEMGLGKAQPVSEPVLTPSGWRPIGDLAVGDAVIGGDGTPTPVMGVYPQRDRRVLKVTFSDGSWTRCGHDHLWSVQHARNDTTRRPGHWRAMTTDEILAAGITDGAGNRNWRIPMVRPVVGEARLPIEPYFLGLLLGDGTLGAAYTVGFSSADEQLVESVRLGAAVFGLEVRHRGAYDYGLADRKGAPNRLRRQLNALGLHCGSAAKHVPETYLRASAEDRLALLQGLMDTDGTAGFDGMNEFSSTSDALAGAVAEITESLGGTARRASKSDGAHRVYVKLAVCPFRLGRKASAWVSPSKYPPTRIIASVEPDGEEDMVCIAVAASDQLYVTRHHIVTHNTILSIAAIEALIDAGDAGGGIIVCPASLKRQWARQIHTFTGGQANVATTPSDRKQRFRAYTEMRSGRVEYLIMNYEQVVNDWDVVKHLPRDFVVLDEATAIKSPAAKRSRRIKELKAKWRWALTGQPVENRAEEVFSIMQWVDPSVLGPAKVFDATFIVRDRFGKPLRYRNLPLLHQTLAGAMVRKTWEDPDVAEQMPAVTEESILVDFDPDSGRLYKRIMADLLTALDDSSYGGSFDLSAHYDGFGPEGGAEGMGEVMSRLTAARMVCDHPHLLRLSAAHYAGEGAHTSRMGSAYAYDLRESGALDRATKSYKLEATVELVEEILSANPRNKIVLFSFFKDALDLIAAATARLTDHALFTGDLDERTRDTEKVRFQTDPNCRLFLSSDAGGYGVDLPQANYLISYDLPWSAGAWRQRNARIIRLSSEFHKVTLISMLMAGSIEERQYDALTLKQTAANAILDGRGYDAKGALPLDRESLAEFVRSTT